MMTGHHPRRMLPPGNSRKRKHAEGDKPATPKASEPTPSNRLLAGYLAHEFLTKGTLLGQKFEPHSVPSAGSSAAKPKRSQSNEQAALEATRPSLRKEQESYGEVATIMKTDGTHIKGIVNPTQLSRWIHM